MVGRIIGYVVAAGVILLGLLWLLSSSAAGPAWWSRLILGVILLAVGVVIIWVVRTRGPAPVQQITQQVDLEMPGEISVDKLKCQSCGGELSKDHVSLAQGAVMISCPYCGSTYQITEEPKW